MAKIKYSANERILDIINILCEGDGITIGQLSEKYGFHNDDIIIKDLDNINKTKILGLTVLPVLSDKEDDDDEMEFTEQLKKCASLHIPITVERIYFGDDDESLFSLQLSEVEKLFLKSFLNESETLGDILIKNAPEYASRERVDNLYLLDNAIKNKKSLKVNYEKEKNLIITPLHIVRMVADNLYYCMALCASNVRNFITDKLSIVNVAQDDCKISKEIEKKINKEIEFLDLRWGMEGKSKPFDFEMIVYGEADLYRRLKKELRNRRNACWEKLSPELSDDESCWRYADKVIDRESLKTWLLGLGKSVRVVKPKRLADEIVADAKKRLKYYEKILKNRKS